MSPIIRPLLIRWGLGREYFQASDHPEVRARATLAYACQFHRKCIPLNWLSGRMVRDCITPNFEIHSGAAEIYKSYIHKFFGEPQLKLLADSLYDRKAKAEAQDQTLLGMTIFTLVVELGLNERLPDSLLQPPL